MTQTLPPPSLPHSLNAEKAVLASILHSPEKVLDECLQRQITGKYFHCPVHAELFNVLMEMRDTCIPIDYISMVQILEDRGLLNDVGGESVVTNLFAIASTPINAGHYLEIVSEKFLLREIISICRNYSDRAYDGQENAATLQTELESAALSLGENCFKANCPPVKDLVMEALDSMEKLYQNGEALTGLSSGFAGLDEITNGLHAGQMIVLASRPSMGKTALAMNIAEHVAVKLGKAVAVFSFQLSANELIQRMLRSLARLDAEKVRNGFFGKHHLASLIQATNKLSECKLFIDDSPGLSILELRATARRLKDRHDIQLIVIDYLQNLKSLSKRAQENRQIEIAEISSGIKALARELKIPIVVLAELNRKPESRMGNKLGTPRLSDLRESGSIEQDADVVGLLWREDYYAESEEEHQASEGRAELFIAKQRNGPVGSVPLTFHKQITRFEDRAFEREEPPR